MKIKLVFYVCTRLWLGAILILSMTSCGAHREMAALQRQIAHTSSQLGIDIKKGDPIYLYFNAASWMGVPYRYGGTTRRGIDCSGLAGVLNNTDDRSLQRHSGDIYEKDCKRVRYQRNLKPGDFVFFRTQGSKRINHVGVYLKDHRFVHAASSGVRVDDLRSTYYQNTLYRMGRLKE